MKSKWVAVFFIIVILCITGCAKAPRSGHVSISECAELLIF